MVAKKLLKFKSQASTFQIKSILFDGKFSKHLPSIRSDNSTLGPRSSSASRVNVKVFSRALHAIAIGDTVMTDAHCVQLQPSGTIA